MYQGGKSRISRRIADEILKYSNGGGGKTFISLFCGGCSVEAKLVNNFDKAILNDNHEYLIEMYNGVKNGYELPDIISKEDYYYIKNHKEENKVLAGFVGFGCSFGGKWFEGYAKNSKGRNYARNSKKSILRNMEVLKKAIFICKDYRDVELEKNSVIYADPPYNNTTGYQNRKFDSNKFWEYARETSKEYLMFISELEAPEDFVPIWQREVVRCLDVNKNNMPKVIEKLFVHKCNIIN